MTAKKKQTAAFDTTISKAKRAAVTESLMQPLRLELQSVSDMDGQTQLFKRVTLIRDRVSSYVPFLPGLGVSEDELVAMAKKLWDEYVVAYDFPRIPNAIEPFLETICWQWLEWSIRRLITDELALRRVS